MPALIFPAPGPVGNNNVQLTGTANSFTGFSVTKSFISSKTSLRVKNPLPKNNEVNNRRVGNVNRRDVIRNPLPKNNEVNNFKVIGKVSRGFVVKPAFPKNNEVNNRRVGKVNIRNFIRNPLPKNLDVKVFDAESIQQPFKIRSNSVHVIVFDFTIGKVSQGFVVKPAFPKNNEVNNFKVIGEVSKGIVVKPAFPKNLDNKVFDVNLIQPLKLSTSRTQVFSLNKIVTQLNKAFTVLRTPLPNRLFGKLKSVGKVKTDVIFSLKTTIANVSSNVRQNTVSTTTAPRNARENFYYFTIAPGKRQDLARDIFFKTTPGLIDIRSLSRQANITSNVAQANVSTKLAPTNARENFYYFTIAPGKRADEAREPWSKPFLAYINIAALNGRQANISSNVRQNTVSTLVSPTNARENFYYFTLAPGKRADKARAPWSKPLTITVIKDARGVITSNVRQNTVITLLEPTNARENFYYFNIAPGKRVDKSRRPWSNALLPVVPAFPKSLESKVVTVLNNPKLIIKTPHRSRVYLNTLNVSNFIAQSNVYPTTAPTTPRENLYYSIIAPGLYSSRNRFAATTTPQNRFNVTQLTKPIVKLKPAFSKSLEEQRYRVSTLKSGFVARNAFPKNLDNKVFDVNLVQPFKLPNTSVHVIVFKPTLGKVSQGLVVRNALPKNLEIYSFKPAKVSQGLVVRNAFPKNLDDKVFDANYGIFKVPFTQTEVFSLNTTLTQLNKAYIVLKNVFPKNLDDKVFDVETLTKPIVVIKNVVSKEFDAKIFKSNFISKGFVVRNAFSKLYDQRIFKVDLVEPFKLNQFQSTVFHLQPNLGKIFSIMSKTGRVFSAADPAFKAKSEPLQFWN